MTRILRNNKILLFVIAILLIANIAILWFFLSTKPVKPADQKPQQDRVSVSRFLKEEIKFTPAQMKQYDSLKKIHWAKMRPIFKGMNTVKDSFYSQLNNDRALIDSSFLNRISDSIAVKQKILDINMFSHFRNIRGLCTPEQIPVYDSTIQAVIRIMINPYRKREKKAETPPVNKS